MSSVPQSPLKETVRSPRKRSGWAVPEGMRLVQIQLPKPLWLRFKMEALKRDIPFSGILTAYLAQTAEGFDFERLVVPKGADLMTHQVRS